MEIYSRPGLQAWLQKTATAEASLRLDKADLMRHEAAGITVDRYPKTLIMGGTEFALSYHFEPTSPKDGVTLILPLTLLNQVDSRRCEWLVPGMCEEKTQVLLRSLPQKLRRHCVPIVEYAKDFLERRMAADEFGKGDYLDSLIQDLRQVKALDVKRSDFRLEAIPPHLLMNFRLLDEHGRQLELERNLPRLKAEFGDSARLAFQAVALAPSAQNRSTVASGSYTQWDFGELEETLEIQKAGKTLFGYPALVDCGAACELAVFDDLVAARKCHWLGLRRLFALSQRDTLKALQKQLPHAREIGLLFMQIGTVDSIIEQILNLALERAFMAEPLPRNREQFQARLKAGKPRLALIAQEIARHLLTALEAHADVQKKLAQAKALSSAAHADISQQIQGLIFPHCIAETSYAQLVHLPRYLKAIVLRIDKLRANPSRDVQAQREWESLARPWQKLLQGQKGGAAYVLDEDARLQDFRWQLEELRVALFAQELKTPMPISAKRLEKVLQSLYK